jgi:hypothetical protein
MMGQQKMFERGDGHRSRRWAISILCAMSALVLAMAGSAQASVISVGSVLPEKFTATEFTRVQTFFNTALPQAGANLASPVNGAIVSWRIQGASGGPFYLRVLHPNGKGAFEAAGTSLPAIPTNEGLQTFATNLKVQAGDLIGIDPTNSTNKIGIAETSGASFASIFPTPFDGSVVPPSETFSGKEIELSALVQPAPEITAIAPNFGPVTGSTAVTITGKNLGGATAVQFGTVSATNVTVESDTEITATAPPSAKPGKVDVSVTTLAGDSADTRYDDYVYRACVVPGLKNKTLGKAKTLIKRGDCKLGHVKKVVAPKPGKVGKVLKQAPKPGKVLVPGARVRITLGE